MNLALPIGGQEYARIRLKDYPPGGQLEARVGASGWQPVIVDGDVGRVLLRGPSAPGTEGILVAESGRLFVRLVDNPEVVIRNAGGVILIP